MAARKFYRTQSGSSYTHYDNTGFASQGHYDNVHPSHWLNKDKIERHLDWNDRSLEPTPFISVFDNLAKADAEERAALFKRRREQVFIAEITIPDPQQSTIEIEFSNENVLLPVLLHRDNNGNTTTFISTPDVRMHLKVAREVSKSSEWFALGYIPRNIITGVWSR